MSPAADPGRNPRDVVEFLDASGMLDLDAVVDALHDEVVEVGSFTDEELYWLRDDGPAFEATPRLGNPWAPAECGWR